MIVSKPYKGQVATIRTMVDGWFTLAIAGTVLKRTDDTSKVRLFSASEIEELTNE